MTEVTSPVTVQDTYQPLVAIGPAPDVRGLFFSVATAPVFARFWKPDVQLGASVPILDPTEFGPIAANTIGNSAVGACGVEFRNAVPSGPNATIWGELDYANDVTFEPGSPVPGVLLPNGTIIQANVPSSPSLYVTGSASGLSGTMSTSFSLTLSTTLLAAASTYLLSTFFIQGFLTNSSTSTDDLLTMELKVGTTVLAQALQAVPANTAGQAIPFVVDCVNILPFLTAGGALTFTATGSLGASYMGYNNTAWLAQAVLAY